MKKMIAFVFAWIFVLSLAGCNEGKPDDGNPSSNSANSTVIQANDNVLKVGTGEVSEEQRIDAISEYQNSYDNIVSEGTAEESISFETDFEVSGCSVSRLSPTDDNDLKVELNGYIDLFVETDCDGNKVTIDTGWWHTEDGWVKNYPVWSYLVRVADGEGVMHYYYFRVDYDPSSDSDETTEEEESGRKITVSSLPEGYYNESFSGDDADAIIDYLSNLNLISDFPENPDECGGWTWVISIECENGDVVTVYHFGQFIRADGGPWYKMDIYEAAQFDFLLEELSK